ncbi:MAG: helix-hairpin-helix domain-containing protein [Gemmatimonadota bacterium]|nr:helix-hairpin-helix domain-containing protein [Gemmatimonadota bacterium]
MDYFTRRHKWAIVALCVLALLGAGFRWALDCDRKIAPGAAPGRLAADSALAARLTRRAAGYNSPVDLNTAGMRALERLSGVGPGIARRIVAEREAGGPFRSPSDLAARVRGIGPGTVERWGDSVTFSQ